MADDHDTTDGANCHLSPLASADIASVCSTLTPDSTADQQTPLLSRIKALEDRWSRGRCTAHAHSSLDRSHSASGLCCSCQILRTKAKKSQAPCSWVTSTSSQEHSSQN